MSVAHVQAGDLAYRKGEPTTADFHYREALKLAEHRVELPGSGPSALEAVYATRVKLADLARSSGDPRDADFGYREAVLTAIQIREAVGDTPATLGLLAVAYENVGYGATDFGDLDTSETNYRHMLAIAETCSTNSVAHRSHAGFSLERTNGSLTSPGSGVTPRWPIGTTRLPRSRLAAESTQPDRPVRYQAR